MGCGCNQLNNTCGDTQYAQCVKYEEVNPWNDGTTAWEEGDDLFILQTFTTLTSGYCYSTEEILADLIKMNAALRTELDLTELLSNGITYTLTEGRINVKDALKRHAELILELQELTNGEAGVFNITGWKDFDFGCIADACDSPPTTLRALLELMIAEICSLRTDYDSLDTRVTTLEGA